MGRDFRFYGERPVRDSALILKVDDLINIATGKDKNVVDLKMLQFILYILAGHVSILEQMVELRIPTSGELPTMEDEYYDDIKRRGGAQKPSERDKKSKSSGGKQGVDKTVTERDKDTVRDRRLSKDDDYDRAGGGRSRRQERADGGRDIEDKKRDKKSGVKDEDYDKEGRGMKGQEEKHIERDKETSDRENEIEIKGRYRKDETIDTEDYHSEDGDKGRKGRENEYEREVRGKKNRDEEDRDGHDKGRGRRYSDQDYEKKEKNEKIKDEKDRDGEGRGRHMGRDDEDKVVKTSRKSSFSDEEYERVARGRKDHDEGRRRKYSEDRGSRRIRGDIDEDYAEEKGRKGKVRDEDKSEKERGRKRSRSLDIEGLGRGRRRSRDRSIDKDGQIRHGSLDRPESIPIKVMREDKNKVLEKFSDTREEIAKKSQGTGVGTDVGSFLVQVKQRRVAAARDGGLGCEPGRVRGDRSGRHRQYDADSAGGGGRDDRYQGGGGGRNIGDGRGGSEGGVGGRTWGGGGGSGGGRDWDDHRRRRKCDTGKRRKGAKSDEEDDEDEEELLKARERNESFEAGGLWKCTGRDRQESFEETEGLLVADSKGNMKFVPLRDGKERRRGPRDERSYRDRGKDGRGYERDGRGKDYDRDYDRDRNRDDRTEDDYDRSGRGVRTGDRDKWGDKDRWGDRDEEIDSSDRIGWDRERDRDTTDRDRDDRDGKDRDRGGWDMEDYGDARGRKGERDGRRGREDEDRDGRYERERDRDGRDYTDSLDDSRGGRDGRRDRDRDRRAGRGDRGGRKRGKEEGGIGFLDDDESGRAARKDGKEGYRAGRAGGEDDETAGDRGGRYDGSGRGKDREGTKRYRDGEDWDTDDEHGRGRRGKGVDGKDGTQGEYDDYGRTVGSEDKGKGRGRDEEGSGKGGRYGVDDDRYGRDDGEKRGRRGHDDRTGGQYDDQSNISGVIYVDKVSGKSPGERGARREGESRKRRDKGKRDGDESISGDEEDGRQKRIDRKFEDEDSGDEEDGKRGKRRGKGGERDVSSGKRGDGRDGKGRGRDEGIGESEEDELGRKQRRGDYEEGVGKRGRGMGGLEEESDEDGGIGARKGKKSGRTDDDEGLRKGRKGKEGYLGESDEDDGRGGKGGKRKGRVDGDERKGRVDGDEDEGKRGRGKEYLGESDKEDGRDGITKGRADDDESVGKGARGKGEYSGESDEGDDTGEKDRKKIGDSEAGEKYRKKRGDSEDEYLDRGKGGRGKGKGRDVEQGEVGGGKSGKKGDKDRSGREKDVDSILSKGERDIGGTDKGGRDIEGKDAENLAGKEDKRRGGKRGKEGDRGVDESSRKGREKDAESISSKGGKDRFGVDAKGKDSERLTDKGGKGKGGKESDDYDKEDDIGGRGGAGKGAGRGKSGDKGAAEQKGLKGREASLTSVTTGASVGRGGKGAAGKSGKPGSVGREGSTPRVGSIEVVTRTQFQQLEKAVEELQKKAGPMAQPIMPGNKQLLADISRGDASLTDVIQALQLQARLQAAERAIDRMADLIAQLAAAGALTPEMLAKVAAIHSEVAEGYKEVPLGPGGKAEQVDLLRKRISTRADSTATAATIGTLASIGTTGTAGTAGTAAGGPGGAGGGRRVSVPPSPPLRPAPGGRSSKLPGMMLERFARLPMVTGSGLSAGAPSQRSGKTVGSEDCITAQELDNALTALREEFERTLAATTARANNSAEHASTTAKNVADKLDTALDLSRRLSTLYTMVDDYTEQLNGFDAGVSTQIEGFQQQMGEMKNDLMEGLEQLQNVNNNAETAAVLELSERYEGLVADLDVTLHNHQNMTTQQDQLSNELQSLLDCVEMLRESKADRDEVLDGLRDKADISRLEGLLTEEAFARARGELELRMRMCYDKFHAQDHVWMGAVKEISNVIANKAEVMQLMGTRDDMQEQLHQLNRKCIQLTRMLGDPKAAVLARKLARDGTCASCKVPALMEPTDISTTAPPALPALPAPRGKRPEPAGADSDVCLKDVSRLPRTDLPPPSDIDDEKDVHICKRWVGGSHTLVTSQVTRARAPPPQARTLPTRRYVGPGTDGKLYMLAEACIPCEECNTLYIEKIPGEIEVPHGHSSAASDITVVTGTEARRVTIISEKDLPGHGKEEEKDEKRPSVTERRPSMVERQSLVPEPHPSMIGKRLSMAERPSIIEKQFMMVSNRHPIIEKRLSKVEKRMSLVERKSSSAERAMDGSDRSMPVVEYKLKGSKESIVAFEDQIPRKLSDIGILVKGRVTLVDEEAARRAEIRFEAARLEALQGATAADNQNPDNPDEKDKEKRGSLNDN